MITAGRRGMATNPSSGGSMTKRDLIDEVVKRYPRLSSRDAESVVNVVFDSMTESLAGGGHTELRGFGSFVVRHRQAREGRNPKTGALVLVAAKRVPFFKVGKELRLRVKASLIPSSDATTKFCV